MREHRSTTRSLPRFFALLVVVSLPFWLAGAAPAALVPRVPLIDLPLSALVAFAPMIAALILVSREEGTDGAKRFLRRAFEHRGIREKRWYLPILCLMPAILLVEYGVMKVMDPTLPGPQASPLLLAFFAIFFVTAIGEELGWTGYATDPLLARRPALTTGLLLGAVWALWHTVTFVQTTNSLTWVFWQSLTTVGLRVLIVWLYANTGRSVFAAVMFHTVVNVSEFTYPVYGSHYDPFIATILIAIVVAIVTFLWGAQTLARYRYA